LNDAYKVQEPGVREMAERYVEKDPGDDRALLILGRILMRDQSHADALKVWERLLAIHPEDAHYHLQAARCCSWLKLPDRGIEAARQALHFDPSLAEARKIIGQLDPQAPEAQEQAEPQTELTPAMEPAPAAEPDHFGEAQAVEEPGPVAE